MAKTSLTGRTRLLIDAGPVAGGHGQRGIGRHVASLLRSMLLWEPDRLERVWALALPRSMAVPFRDRAVGPGILSVRPTEIGWLTGCIATALAMRSSRAAVFHATDPQRPLVGSRVAQIVNVYDLIPLHEREVLGSWRADHRAIYRAYLAQIHRARRLIANSAATARDINETLGVPLERIDVVYPAVEATGPRWSPPPDPRFLWVGALDAHKQPDLAIRALARFRGTERAGVLRLVGPADPVRVRQLTALAHALGVDGDVEFLGRVTDAELDAAYASASALVVTSRIEGLGLPGIEAVLRGTPVIAVDTPASRETVGAVARLVVGDEDALAAAMRDPLPPNPLRAESIRSAFAPEAVAAALWSSYQMVL